MANKIIRLIFLSITIMLLSVSVYYSRGWHVFVKMPGWIAWGLSGAFVASATALFDLAIGRFLEPVNAPRKIVENKINPEYIKIKSGLILVGIFFMSVWFILTAYSMYSTLAGQFNKMLLSTVLTYEVSEVQLEIDRLQKQIDKSVNEISEETIKILIGDIDSKIELLINEKKTINKTLSGISGAEEAATYRTAVRDANGRLLIIESELEKLSIEKRELLIPVIIDNSEIELEIKKLREELSSGLTDEEKLILQEDIFGFISGVFSTESRIIDKRTVRFIALAFPSILVDLISPIFSALFIYGLGKNKKSYSDGRHDAFSEIDAELTRRLNI